VDVEAVDEKDVLPLAPQIPPDQEETQGFDPQVISSKIVDPRVDEEYLLGLAHDHGMESIP
jgi:hypothetical protein